eukprot:scaffold1959_cov162-Amphora_coffeaeformis.AAC.3
MDQSNEDDDTNFERVRLSAASYHNNSCKYPMSQNSQTPPRRDSTSTASPSSGSHHKQPPRRTIVHLNFSSQSDEEEEGENPFAKLESFLEGKFENDDDPDEPKLHANNDNDNKLENRCNYHLKQKDDYPVNECCTTISTPQKKKDDPLLKVAVSVTEEATENTKHALMEQQHAASSLTGPRAHECTMGTNESHRCGNYEDDDFPLPDSPEHLSQTSTIHLGKRPLRPAARSGNHSERSSNFTQNGDNVHDGDFRNHLLDWNRKASQKLQQQQQPQQRHGLVASGTARPAKKSRVVPSQSSLVGSLPQRWMTQQTTMPAAVRKPLSKPSSSSVKTNNTRLVPPVLIQSTPAWRRPSKPKAGQKNSAKNEPTTTATSYRPFGADMLSSMMMSPQEARRGKNGDGDDDDDAIADVPATTVDPTSPMQKIWWESSTAAGHSPSRSPRKAASKRGPLLTSFLAAKDKWQSDQLRLYNTTTTMATSSSSSFSFLSNPTDDPRRKARSYTDVTILGPGRTTTSGGFLVHLVFLHQHSVSKEDTVTATKEFAWGCFQRGQQTGDALRIYNAVVVPWSNAHPDVSVKWTVVATQVYEPCPRDDLPTLASILGGLNKEEAPCSANATTA